MVIIRIVVVAEIAVVAIEMLVPFLFPSFELVEYPRSRLLKFPVHTLVFKLRRVRIMNITLDGIPNGQWRYLTDAEVAAVRGFVPALAASIFNVPLLVTKAQELGMKFIVTDDVSYIFKRRLQNKCWCLE